jgi:tetratricopeptide (TPR) repeat protein
MDASASSAAIAGARSSWAVLAAALAAITLAAYVNGAGNGFVWDDVGIIVENPATRDVGGIGALALAPDMVKPYYRPVTRVSFLLDYVAFGMNASGFHAVSIAIHVANVLLLFALGLRLFGRRLPAFAAALLLAVHPVNVESVSFVSARNNLLALMFVLVAVHLLARAWERRRPWLFASLSGFSWFLALLSKESAAAAVVFFAGWVLSPLIPAQVRRRTRLLSLGPHLAFAVLYLVVRRIALGDVVGAGLGPGGVIEALRVNYHVVPRYLELIVFPARLTIFHSVPETGPFAEPWLLGVWVALALGTVLLLRGRSVPALLAVLWVAANYAPIANLVPIPSSAMAERFLYLPAVGVWVLVGAGIGALSRHAALGRTTAVLGALCAAALAAKTVSRNVEWRDDVTLFRSAVRVDPASTVGLYNLGCALRERGDLEGARGAWERAIEVDPRNAGALAQLGTVFAIRGDLARAERLYVAALDANAEDAAVRFNLAMVYDRLGRRAEAIARYDEFLRAAREDDAALVTRALERRTALHGASGSAKEPAAP